MVFIWYLYGIYMGLYVFIWVYNLQPTILGDINDIKGHHGDIIIMK
jgi:hypothetical protein